MASAPRKVNTTKTTTISASGTTTTSNSTVRQGGNVTTTKTTTIKKANAPAKATTAKKSGGTKKSSAKTPAKFGAAALGGTFLHGPNDSGWQLCGPVAVANSLLAVTGAQASNGAIERLYRDAGGHRDSGVTIEAVLAAAASTGLAGYRLAGYRQLDGDLDLDAELLLLLALDFTPDAHAVATIGGGRVACWGDALYLSDMTARIEDAWSLTWHGKAQ